MLDATKNYEMEVARKGVIKLLGDSRDWPHVTTGTRYTLLNKNTSQSWINAAKLYRAQMFHKKCGKAVTLDLTFCDVHSKA